MGAQVFYGSPKDLNHTGVVVSYDDTFIHTVEGNTNDTGARDYRGFAGRAQDCGSPSQQPSLNEQRGHCHVW